MPQRRKGARLWLKPAYGRKRSVYFIKDDGHVESTGCGADDIRGAERALAIYIAQKHAREAAKPRRRSAEETPISDVLTVYWRDRGATVARPEELKARLVQLTRWWGAKAVGEIHPSLIADYVKNRGYQAAARRELEDLRAAIHHAAKMRVISAVVPVVLPPRGRPRERWLTRDEVAKLLWAAWRYREVQKGHKTGRRSRRHIARWILVARYTGSRAGAICSASFDEVPGRGWVDLENGLFYRAADREVETKKRKPTIRVPGPLLAHMRRWQAAGQQYVVEWYGRPVTKINKAFRSVVEDAELGPGVMPHTFRHTVATWLLRGGADKWEVAGFLGMTMQVLEDTYGHHAPDHQGSVHKAISARNGSPNGSPPLKAIS